MTTIDTARSTDVSATARNLDTDVFGPLRARLTGSVVTRSAGYWDVTRAAWVVDRVQRPSAVVHAVTAEDVAETLAFAAEHDLHVEPRVPDRHSAGLAATVLLRTCAVTAVELH